MNESRLINDSAICGGVSEIREGWTKWHEEWRSLGVQVDGAALADEAIADLQHIAESYGQATLTLTHASALAGYTPDHLSRLIREGMLTNHGRKGKPLVRRSELPTIATRSADQESVVHGETLAKHGVANGVCPECAHP